MSTLGWKTDNGWKTVGDRFSRQLWRLESDALCAEARHRTGLEYFGEPAIDPALTILLNSLENEADLHLMGRFLVRVHLRDLLTTRLQLVNLWSEYATTIAASRIQRPIFITGMPRSGSTFLHELLAEDPANRAPRVWEVMFPVPFESQLSSNVDRRVRKTEFYLRCFRSLAIVKRIYDRLGVRLMPAVATQMQRLASNRSRYRRRKLSATPALDCGAELTRFDAYYSRFGVSLQND